MNGQDAIERLHALMERAEALSARMHRLNDENRALRAEQQQLMNERADLIARNEQARVRVEALIHRIRTLEDQP